MERISKRHFKVLCTIKEKTTDLKLKIQFKPEQFAWNQNRVCFNRNLFFLRHIKPWHFQKIPKYHRKFIPEINIFYFSIGPHPTNKHPWRKYGWTLKSGHHGPTDGVKRQRSELSIDSEDSERPARKQTGLQCSCSTFGQQLSWENQGGDERRKKQLKAQFVPVRRAQVLFVLAPQLDLTD